MRVPATSALRLGRYLDETGTRQTWLAEQIGVSRSHLNNWLAGRQPIPVVHQHAIIEALRRRNLTPLRDLFETEGEHADAGV